MFVVFYNDMGGQIERYLFDPTIGNYGICLPAGPWETDADVSYIVDTIKGNIL